MRRSAIPLTAIVTTLAIVLSSPTTVQPAFAHADTILPVNIEDDEEQQQGGGIVVVVGHTNEPAYGAKPGMHDGLHGLKVTTQQDFQLGTHSSGRTNITLQIWSHLTVQHL